MSTVSEYSAKKGELARQDSIRAKRTFQLWIRNWTTAQNEENNIICQPCTAPHGFNTFFSCYIFNLHYYFLHLSNSVKCCQTTKNISRFQAWIFFLLLKCFLGECLGGNPAKITLLQFTTFVAINTKHHQKWEYHRGKPACNVLTHLSFVCPA